LSLIKVKRACLNPSISSCSHLLIALHGALASLVSTLSRPNVTESPIIYRTTPVFYRPKLYVDFNDLNKTFGEAVTKQQQQQQQQQKVLRPAVAKPQLRSIPSVQPKQEQKQQQQESLPKPFIPMPTPQQQQPSSVTKEKKVNLFPTQSTTSTFSSADFQSIRQNERFPVFKSLKGSIGTRLKVFNKFKFKGFALSFIKSATELKALGFGVKIPITPNFPIYDSMIYLPRVVALVSLNYPFCWKLSFTINVPLQVIMFLSIVLLDYYNRINEAVMSLGLVRRLIGDQMTEKERRRRRNELLDGEYDEENSEMINSFSDRETTTDISSSSAAQVAAAKKKKQQIKLKKSSSTNKLTMPVLKASDSVKRVGLSVSYKWTAWKAASNGWTIGPAFNYVSSLIITNKLLPMMILVSVCFFSIAETAVLLLYWMYEIYYFVFQNFLVTMNGLVYWFQSNMGTLVNNNEENSQKMSQRSNKIYFDSPTPLSLNPERKGVPSGRKPSENEEFKPNYFVNSNNDVEIYSESDQDRIEDQRRMATINQETVPDSVSAPQHIPQQQSSGAKIEPKSFVSSMRNKYSDYARMKLDTQRPLGIPVVAASAASSTLATNTPHTLWQINWKKIEKWILTKSPVFGYSMSTALFPFPSKGLKLATNVNFDIQGFHPWEAIQRIVAKTEFGDNSFAKTSFVLGTTPATAAVSSTTLNSPVAPSSP
jgi:hypothetical protein